MISRHLVAPLTHFSCQFACKKLFLKIPLPDPPLPREKDDHQFLKIWPYLCDNNRATNTQFQYCTNFNASNKRSIIKPKQFDWLSFDSNMRSVEKSLQFNHNDGLHDWMYGHYRHASSTEVYVPTRHITGHCDHQTQFMYWDHGALWQFDM